MPDNKHEWLASKDMWVSIIKSIIGIIIGGVFAGRSLIRTSELQAAAGEYQTYVTAVTNFQNKY